MNVIKVVTDFVASIPSRVWGFVCTAAVLLIMLWALVRGVKKEAKQEAKVEELRKDNVALTEVAKTIKDDATVVAEVRNTINALPDPDLSKRADRWVRD